MLWIEKSNLPELIQALGQDWVNNTHSLVSSHGKVAWLLSGGSTPSPFYEWLAKQDLPWNHIRLYLVDERMVKIQDAQSNERMLREAFGPAFEKGAVLHSMVANLDNLDANMAQTAQDYASLNDIPFLCLLGMGQDGHTASLFPNDAQSELGLVPDSPALLLTLSPKPPHQRMSVGVSVFKKAIKTYLLFAGAEKKAVCLHASKERLPVARVLEHLPNLAVYFTP